MSALSEEVVPRIRRVLDRDASHRLRGSAPALHNA
jgi:hypothetical protein